MIVAVTGGKGGVGKSTVALNLGSELDAIVVDADLAMADLPRGRGPDLHDVLAGRADPLEAVTRVGGVELLPCGRTLAGARAADLTAFDGVVDRVAREFGRVVIDCPAGLAGDVGVQLHVADVAVIVTNPDRAALSDAVRTRRLAREIGTPLGAVVLNRARDDDRVDAIEDALGAPVTVVPGSTELRDAQAAGRPVRDVFPESPAATRLSSLAATLEKCERAIRRSGAP